jgi:predicted 3-demethylubiquinone-9 3-methyltransferase (glyoxalase superfamily)
MASPGISTCLWYDGGAEEAARFYVSLFEDARITSVMRQSGPDGPAGPAFLVEFELAGQRYQAMNGGPMYRLTEAASIVVLVDGQAEVDRLWSALTAEGGAESRCGWCKDRWGLSWQIIPRMMVEAIRAGGPAAGRVIQAIMGMAKLDVAALEAAAKG